MDAVREVYLNRPGAARRCAAHGARRVGRPLRRRHAGHRELAVRAGVVTQYAQTAPGEFAGVLHSDQYRLTERLRFNEATGELEVTWTHEDPLYFTGAQSGGPATFVRRADLRVAPYNCVPDPL